MQVIKKDLLFFLLLGVLFFLLSGLITHAAQKDERLVQSRNQSAVLIQKEPENTIDILILGDSLAYSSISPMQIWNDTGNTAFVCAQSGQKMQEAYYLLKTALKHQSPKLVILESNVMFRKQDGLEGVKESVAGSAGYYFPLFRFHDIWKSGLTGKRYAEAGSKGFLIRKGIAPYEGGEYMKETDKCTELSRPVTEDLEKILKLCREKDIPLLLLSTPSPKNYSYRRHNAITAYAAAQALDYLDLNLSVEELGMDWSTDSLDNGDHLNLSGACKVTGYLEKYLSSRYELPDHRKETAYAAWQTEAQQYEDDIRTILEEMCRN